MSGRTPEPPDLDPVATLAPVVGDALTDRASLEQVELCEPVGFARCVHLDGAHHGRCAHRFNITRLASHRLRV